MAKYDVTHSCGHAAEHQLYGKLAQREYRMERLAEETCPDCQAAERDRANQQAARDNADAGLPSLTGSDKQIKWAESIRQDILADTATLRDRIVSGAPDDAERDRALSALRSVTDQTSAAWWIDNRDYRLLTLVQAAARKSN